MKLTIIILSTIVLIAFVGMFYWMYKARKGSLNLNKNAWHFKLMNYMWEAETSDIRNACPYYWSLVFSVLILIPYLIIRYFYMFHKYIYSLFPKKKEKEVKIKPPKIKLEKTFSKYSYIYSRSKQILERIIIIIFCIHVLYAISLYEISFRMLIIMSITIYAVITLFLHNKKPELDIYHWNHYRNFFSGLWGILKIPFIIIGWILSSIFSKITNVYVDNCPAIIWKN
jgi:hypothetical protein